MYKAKKVNCSRAPYYFSIYPPHFFYKWGDNLLCVQSRGVRIIFFIFLFNKNKKY